MFQNTEQITDNIFAIRNEMRNVSFLSQKWCDFAKQNIDHWSAEIAREQNIELFCEWNSLWKIDVNSNE